jgi:hypothetical protein
MPNTFIYSGDLSPTAKKHLERRERTIEDAFEEPAHFEWMIESTDGSEMCFILLKRGLVDTILARLSESDIVSLSDRDFTDIISAYDVQDEMKRSKQYIKERIADWASRLSALFHNVESWIPEGWSVVRGSVVQRNEELMQKYSVAPRNMPTLSVSSGKRRIDLVPSALWVFRADGRVNILTSSHQYIVVDRRENKESSSDWHIVLGKRRTETVPFTQEVFIKLLGQA